MSNRNKHGQASQRVVRRHQWLFTWLLAASAPASVQADEPTRMHQDLQALQSPSSLTWAGVGVLAAVLVHPWDDKVQFGLSGQPVVRGVLDVVDLYGSNRYATTSLLAAWSAARLLGLDPVTSMTSELLRAVFLANVLVTPLKFAVGRQRPDGSNRLSFPSGHSANAFALTTVVGRRLHPFAASLLYTATAAVPVSRVHRRRHFLSDVITGSILGIVAGRAVTGVGSGPDSMHGLRFVPINMHGQMVLGIWEPLP